MGERTDRRASTASEAVRGFDGQLFRLVGALVSVDLLVIGIGIAVEANPLAILLAHVLLLAACAWCFAPAPACDRTLWTVSLVLLLIAGPLGGLSVILLALVERCGAPEANVLAAWYDWLSGGERSDATLRMHEGILTGREFQPTLREPRNFADVIEKGTLPEKQALLGHIGLRYHGDFFPLLSSALRSPRSAVRAQAAAIFVKLKEDFRRRLHADRHSSRAVRRNKDVPAMLACARSIVDCAESGFLDPAEVCEALANAKALCLDAAELGSSSTEQAMILCRIIAASDEDDGWLDRFVQSAPVSCSQTRRLAARCLVAAGRHADLHRMLFAVADGDDLPGRTAGGAPFLIGG
jgi:hypothetical protein